MGVYITYKQLAENPGASVPECNSKKEVSF